MRAFVRSIVPVVFAMLTNQRSSYGRLLKIHAEILASRFPNVSTLARLLEWSEKTIRRDIEYLRDSLGAPLAYHRHRRGYHYTRNDFQLPAIAISEGELLGVFLGSQLLRQYRGTELGDHLARLFTKLADFLPDALHVDFSDFQQNYAARTAPAEPIEPAVMQALIQSVRKRQRLEIVYYTASRDLTQQRRIDPYGFQFVDGECYLIAFCHLREDVIKFHPGRIRKWIRTHETFERPADFDLASYLDEGFRKMRGSGPPQEVTLRFSPSVARYLEFRTWHKTQKTERQSDGSLLLRFTINDFLEVKRLALSYGPNCEVLEPATLREEYAADVRGMMGKIERQGDG